MKRGGGGCEVEAGGINHHITVSSRPHPLKIWSRPDDLLLDAGPAVPGGAPPSSMGSSRCRLVLRNVACRARPGELLAIVGPSGAGKSTLLEVLSGRLHPSSSGHLRVNGTPVDAAALRRLCGYVTQRDVLFPLLTVRKTLHFSARLRLGPGAYDPDAVNALVTDLALSRVADARVKDLSGGERRRVSIGVEAVHDPAVLMLDEPTSGLDSASALQIVAALRAMADTPRGAGPWCSASISPALASSRCSTPSSSSPQAASSTTVASTPSAPSLPTPDSASRRTWTPLSSPSTPWTTSASTFSGTSAETGARCSSSFHKHKLIQAAADDEQLGISHGQGDGYANSWPREVAVLFQLVLAVVFAAPAYWLTGLQRTAPAFGYSVLLIWLVLYTANSVVLCFAAAAPDFMVGNAAIQGVLRCSSGRSRRCC